MFFAVAELGGINTTANPMYGAEELERQLRDAGATILVTAPPLAEKARVAAAAVGIGKWWPGRARRDAPGSMRFSTARTPARRHRLP